MSAITAAVDHLRQHWKHRTRARSRLSVRALLMVVLCVLSATSALALSTRLVMAGAPTTRQLPAPQRQTAVLSGVVFRDFNFNGQHDDNEPGLSGVQVSAYSDAGLVASVTTMADGTYAFQSGLTTGPLRLELTNVPADFYPSHFYSVSGQSEGLVRFVQSLPATAHFALSTPSDFCASNPLVATSCFVSGNALTGTYRLLPALVSFPYQSGTSSTVSNAGVSSPVTHTLSVPANMLGSVWGLAYQRESGLLLAAAFTKRHAGFGPGGTGGIYAVNPANNTASVLVNLNVLFPGSTGPDSHNQADFSLDNSAWDAVGKTALGGIDLSSDGETLWVMNLFNRRLYRLPIGVPAAAPAAAQVVSYTLPSPAPDATGCVFHPDTAPGELNRNVRPFAVKATANSDAGYVYLGLVCTAESSNLTSDLRAFVYRLDVATGQFAMVAAFSLNYTRGCVLQVSSGACADAEWLPWGTQATGQLPASFAPFGEYFYPQPILSDIDFDDAGNMLVSLSDRFGHQSSEPNLAGVVAGDLLKLGRNVDGTFTLEQNGQVGSVVTQGQNSNQGPGGGEFYWQDNFPLGSANTGMHQEITVGGLAVLPGSGDVLASAYNPTPLNEDVDGRSVLRTTGPVWFNNATGARSRSYLLTANQQEGYFTEATGMGDVELICDAAPVEVGSRVWLDANANGIQDPSEAPMAGITVRLYGPADTLIASTTTDASGRYFFNTAGPDRILGTADDLSSLGFSASTARRINRYTLRLDNADDYASGAALEGLTPTVPNVNSGPNSGARNSKASVVNGFPTIAFNTGRSGQNNDSYDFGMTVPGQLSGRMWLDADHDGLRAPGDAGVPNSVVTLVGAGSLVLTTTTNAAGEYSFAQVPPGLVSVQFGVPQGYTFTLPMAGDVERDSDVVDLTRRRTGPIEVLRGLAQMNADAGFWKPGPALQIRSFTNGDPANALPGPSIVYNTPVNWTYVVTNTGDIALTDISIIDDKVGLIACPATTLTPGQTMSCAKSGLALGGQYTNVVTAYALDNVNEAQVVASDISHYYGTVATGIQVNALTNGVDADTAPGPQLISTTPVTWTYVITNTGAVALSNISLVDNRLGNIACPRTTLQAGETMSCQRVSRVFSGPYENRATATGLFNVPNLRGTVTAQDYSHYNGVAGASVRGTAWFDVNANGRFDAGEPPLSSVPVLLYRAESDTVALASASTNYQGVYAFNLLPPGDYIVGVQPHSGYRFTTPLMGEPSRDNDIDPGSGRTSIFTLAPGQVMAGVNAGMLAQSAGLSVRVLTNYRPSTYAPGPTIEAGSPVTWSYLVYNTGNFTLTQIQVVDSVQGSIRCSPSPLGPGAPLVCEKYGTAALGAYNSTVVASGSYVSLGPDLTADQSPSSPLAVITATDRVNYVGGRADLDIFKSAIPNPALEGVAVGLNSVVTYTIVITNVGTYTATQVVITDQLPAGMAFQTSLQGSVAAPSPTLRQVGSASNVLSWNVNTLGPGQSLRVVFTSKALASPSTGETAFVNYGYVESAQTPSTRSNSVSHVLRPTAVSVARFTAALQSNGVLLEWRTSAELNSFGFVLHRGTSPQFDQSAMLGNVIPAVNPTGGDYAYFDSSADALVSYYWIEELTSDGQPGLVLGPISTRTDGTVPPVVVPNAVSAASIGGGVAIQPIAASANAPGPATSTGAVEGNAVSQPQSETLVNLAPVTRDQVNPTDQTGAGRGVGAPVAQVSASQGAMQDASQGLDARAGRNAASNARPDPAVSAVATPVAPGAGAAALSTPAPQSNNHAEVAAAVPAQQVSVRASANQPQNVPALAAPRTGGSTFLVAGLILVVLLLAACTTLIALIARSVRR